MNMQFKINPQELVEQFFTLVKIASESGQEQNMISYLQSWGKHLNLACQQDSVGNLLIKVPATRKALKKSSTSTTIKPLLLCAHMDTVSPGKNIQPQNHNGIISSTGKTILGADNKASLAAIIYTIEKLLEQNQLARELELLFTVKEETGGGIEHFPFSWLSAKLGIIFDLPNHPLGGIALRSPFITNFHVTISGKTAHSAQPHQGNNVIPVLQKLLAQIPQGSVDAQDSTVNIGLLAAGTNINAIPGQATISGEVRCYSQNTHDELLVQIEKLVIAASQQYHCDYEFHTADSIPGYQHQQDDLVLTKISEIFTSKQLPLKKYLQAAGSDANVLNHQGIKTFTCADGVKNAHSTTEQISQTDLLTIAELYQIFIQKL